MEEAQMLHPALARALATALVEDRHRSAVRRQTIRLARRVAPEPRVAATPIAIVRSASTRLRGRRAPQADGTTPTDIPQAAVRACQGRARVRPRPRYLATSRYAPGTQTWQLLAGAASG